MHLKALLLASVASFAVAQTATSSAATSAGTSSCQAQIIVDACIGTIQGQINACSSTDYSCLCTGYTNLVNCYAPCPNDQTVGTAQQQRQQNCINASVYGSTTILGTATATSSAATATTSDSDSTVASGFASGTSSGSSASTTSEANAADSLKFSRGVFPMIAAGIVALL